MGTVSFQSGSAVKPRKPHSYQPADQGPSLLSPSSLCLPTPTVAKDLETHT